MGRRNDRPSNLDGRAIIADGPRRDDASRSDSQSGQIGHAPAEIGQQTAEFVKLNAHLLSAQDFFQSG